MPYDLYGQYYASSRDAENAEMAQCAAIDADIAMREVSDMKARLSQQQEPTQRYYEINALQQRIESLEERIKAIESFLVL